MHPGSSLSKLAWKAENQIGAFPWWGSVSQMAKTEWKPVQPVGATKPPKEGKQDDNPDPKTKPQQLLGKLTIGLLALSIINIAVVTLSNIELGSIQTKFNHATSALWQHILPAKLKDCNIKGNINRQGDHIYHTPDSLFYNRTRIDTSKGERWFCSVQEAEGAGWRAPYPSSYRWP